MQIHIQATSCTSVRSSLGWQLTEAGSEYDDNGQNNIVNSNPKKLVGREEDLSTLIETFEEMKRTSLPKKVFVRGRSGTGKTSLVLAIRKTVVQSQGFFCTGNYFQKSEVEPEPYSAITAAFSDLCDLVLQNSSDEQIANIQKELDPIGKYLVGAVSNISPFLLRGEPPSVFSKTISPFLNGKGTNKDSFKNFKSACVFFLRVMSSGRHPVVLFLDDVQWMDEGSREIIEGFLHGGNGMKNLVFILAYRDEAAASVKTIIKNHAEDSGSVHIHLGDLDQKSVYDMVSSRLICKESGDLDGLIKLIVLKTRGNPLYVIEFLKTIKNEGFLNDAEGSLVVDLESIRREMMISDSFAEFLSTKIHRLEVLVQNVLKVAALLGYWAPRNVLLGVSVEQFDAATETITGALNYAVIEGFLDEIDNGYQFTHSKLQASIHGLMKANEREKLHIAIGRKLLESPSTKAYYQAAIHLNRAVDIHAEGGQDDVSKIPINDGGFILWLANINLQASKFCVEKSAFKSSIVFLKKGLELLQDEEKWLKHYNLAFEMTELLAQMEFVVHHFDACRLANNEVLLRTRKPEQKIKALAREIELHIDCCTFNRKACKSELEELDIHIPDMLKIALLRKFRKLRKEFEKKTDDDILRLPCCEAKLKVVTAMKLLNLICGYALFQENSFLAAYCTLMAIEITLRDGICKHSAHSMIHWAVFEVVLGNKNRGYRLGALSLKLIQKIPYAPVACIVVTNATLFCLFLRKSIRDLILLLPRFLDAAFQSGCIRELHYAYSCNFLFRIMLGDNLRELEKSMREVNQLVIDYEGDLPGIRIAMQFVLNLQNNQAEDWKELTILKGEMMKEEQLSSVALNNMPQLILKMILCYCFGFYEDANKIGLDLCKKKAFGHFEKSCSNMSYNFFFGMTSYMLHSISNETAKRKYLRQARKCKKYFIRLSAAGSPDAHIFLSLLEAEEVSRTSKSSEEICIAYDRALTVNSENGFDYLEALACENWARHLYCIGDAETAKVLIARAKMANRKYGSTARIYWLDEQFNT